MDADRWWLGQELDVVGLNLKSLTCLIDFIQRGEKLREYSWFVTADWIGWRNISCTQQMNRDRYIDLLIDIDSGWRNISLTQRMNRERYVDLNLLIDRDRLKKLSFFWADRCLLLYIFFFCRALIVGHSYTQGTKIQQIQPIWCTGENWRRLWRRCQEWGIS